MRLLNSILVSVVCRAQKHGEIVAVRHLCLQKENIVTIRRSPATTTIVEYKASDVICFFTRLETMVIFKETSLVEKHAHQGISGIFYEVTHDFAKLSIQRLCRQLCANDGAAIVLAQLQENLPPIRIGAGFYLEGDAGKGDGLVKSIINTARAPPPL